MCGTVKVKELMLSESAGCFSSMHTSSSKWHIGRLARRIVAKSMKRQSRIGLGGHGGILACQNSSWRLLSCSNWGRRLGTLKRRRNAASGDTGIVEMATINVVWQFLWQHFQTLETLTNRCNSSLAFNSENKKGDYLEHTLFIENRVQKYFRCEEDVELVIPCSTCASTRSWLWKQWNILSSFIMTYILLESKSGH